MNRNRKRKCRLCHEIVGPNNFQIIDEITKEILNVLLLKLNWNVGKKSLICDSCAKSLKASFDFKSVCLFSEDVIFPFITSNNSVDLMAVLLEQNNEYTQINIDKGQQICRLCIKLIEGFFASLTEVDRDDTPIRDVLQRHIPELNLTAIKEPIICRTCLDSLNMLSKFLTMCLNAEKQNQINIGMEASMTNGQAIPNYIKEENKTQDDCKEMSKSESDDCELKGSEIIGENSSGKGFREGIGKDVKIEENGETHLDVKCRSSNAIIKEEINIKSEESECERFSETPCTYPEKFKKRRTSNKTQRQIVRCKACPYTTGSNSHLNRHLLTHRKLSEVKLYKCNKCPFNTKYEESLEKHMERHLDLSERTIYTCDLCSFKGYSKQYYSKHLKYHKNQVEIYKCEVCDYETIDKKCFMYHSLNHKSASEVTMLKCHWCTYETRHRQQMANHMIVHRDPSKITKIACELCDFQTKSRRCLTKHMITHKDPSEMKMHQCVVCSYETKYRYSLKSHMRIHAGPSEVTMYSCDTCTYESKYKASLAAHIRGHKKQQK